MKFDRSTNILIKLILVLIIALLVKTIITTPNNAYASEEEKYSYVWSRAISFKELDDTIKIYSKRGWRLHSHSWVGKEILVIFEKEN